MTLSINVNTPSTKKIVATSVAGAAIGAGAAYGLQKYAIKKATAETAAAEAEANKKGLAKFASKTKNAIMTGLAKVKDGAVWVYKKTKDLAVSAKTKLTDKLAEIGKSGKISKMGIAKTAIGTAILLPVALLVKTALSSKNED